MRKLGLDIGSKTCGIAISDPLNITAQGIENFTFPSQDWHTLVVKIQDILNQYKVDTIVIGYPTFASGDKTATSQLIDEFVTILKRKIALPIVFINENYTTKRAREIMQKSHVNFKKQKKFKDKISAQLILQDYLMTL